MNVPQAAPPVERMTYRESFLLGVFPTFRRFLKNRPSCRAWLARIGREYPLSLAAVTSLLAIVLFFKLMTLWSKANDAAICEWVNSRGGRARVRDDSAQSFRVRFPSFFGRPLTQGVLRSSALVPPSLVNEEGPQLFSKLSQLPRLTHLTVISSQTIANAYQRKTQADRATPQELLIDSDRLQRRMASLPQAVELTIEECNLTPSEQPLDLTGRINGLIVSRTNMSTNFARGLPIIRQSCSVIVNSTKIADGAIEIFLDRIQTTPMHFSNCSMSAETHARLAKMQGVTFTALHIVTPKTNAPPPPVAAESSSESSGESKQE